MPAAKAAGPRGIQPGQHLPARSSLSISSTAASYSALAWACVQQEGGNGMSPAGGYDNAAQPAAEACALQRMRKSRCKQGPARAHRAALRPPAVVPLHPGPRVAQLARHVRHVVPRRRVQLRPQRHGKVGAEVVVPARRVCNNKSRRGAHKAVVSSCACARTLATLQGGAQHPCRRRAAFPAHQVLVASSLSTKLRTSLTSSPRSLMTTVFAPSTNLGEVRCNR